MRRKFNVSKKGYLPDGERVLEVSQITTPVHDVTGEYVMRILSYAVPRRESDVGKPNYSLVFLGGIGSEATGNVDYIAHLEDAFETVRDHLPFTIDKIIVAPHVVGSPRMIRGSEKKQAKFDVGQWKHMHGAARVIKNALEIPEVGLSPDGVVLAGFSAGGTQVTEIASQYKDQCKYLLLAEAAGMYDQSIQKLLYEYSVGSVVAAVKKYRVKGENWRKALADAFWETRIAWGSRQEKVPGLLDMLRDVSPIPISGGDHWIADVAREYGFEGQEAGAPMVVEPLRTDSTRYARNRVIGKVILSPIEQAKVVNTIIGRMHSKYPTIEAIKNAKQDEFEVDVQQMLLEMFPNATGVYYAGYPDMTHATVRVDKGYWENMFSALQQASLSQQANESI